MEKDPGVLILSPFFHPNIGGVETHLDDLCHYLTKHNYQVFVITYQPLTTKARDSKVEKKKNLEIRRISWFGHNWFHRLEAYPLLDFIYLVIGLFFPSFFFLLKRKKEIEVIHAQGLSTAFIAKILSKIFKKRRVVSIHAIYKWRAGSLASRFAKWILSSSDRILTLSKQSKKELVNIRLNKNKIGLYTYWIDQGIFKPRNKERCKEELGWQNKFIVLFVGRLIEKKGMRLLIEVAQKVGKRIYFAFIGEGPLSGEIEKASHEMTNIIYLGRVTNEKLNLYYNASDLVAVPSQYEEGFGRVILEALSCGVPVLGSNKGGIPEAMDESVGVLINPIFGEIKNTIEFLYENPGKLERLARGCRNYALKHFSEGNARVIQESYK